MLFIFRLLRKYLKARRRLFKGKLPHWARDLLELIKYVNVIGPIITLSAIALSPDHFFRRLPQYISRKDSWFGSPIKFFTQGVALMAALSFFIGENLRQLLPEGDRALEPNYTSSSVYWYVLFYTVLAPVCVPLLSVVFAPFAFLMALLSSAISSPLGKNTLQDVYVHTKLTLVPILPSTYARLNWSRFFWSLCYYSIYFYLGTVIILTPLTLFVAAMIDSILQRDTYVAAKTVYLTYAGLVYFVPVFYLVFGPYLAMLQTAIVSPTKVMIAFEYNILRGALDSLAYRVSWKGWSSVDDEVFRAVESLITTFEGKVRSDIRLTSLNMSDEECEVYLAERNEVSRRLINTNKLRILLATCAPKDSEKWSGLFDRIDLISYSNAHPNVTQDKM